MFSSPLSLFKQLLAFLDQIEVLLDQDDRDILGLGDIREAAVAVAVFIDQQDVRFGGHGIDRLLVRGVAGVRALGPALQAFDMSSDDRDLELMGFV